MPEETRRTLRGRTLDDSVSLVAALAGSLALVWVLYQRVLPTSGTLGFIVSWYVTFLVMYLVVSVLRHGRTVVADRLATVVVTGGAMLVGFALATVVAKTFASGWDALRHWNFFTEDLGLAGPLTPLDRGGMVHALIGTLIMIGIAILVTLPLGVLTAVFLTEVGGKLGRVVRTVVEAMTALPSIVAGLFIYATLLLSLGLPNSGFAAAMAMTVMMLPITARAAEVVLRVVPGGLREASLALGASQWQTVWRVVLPTARPGLATALILGVARGIGETSPVLLTAGYLTFINANPFDGPMTSLPLLTFRLAQSPEPAQVSRAFGAASVLLALVLLLFVLARIVAARRPGRR
jgi:phosphate transport system permease protein